MRVFLKRFRHAEEVVPQVVKVREDALRLVVVGENVVFGVSS